MEQESGAYAYDPNHVFPMPYTIISPSKISFTSKNVPQPFFYEVYCPLSCKKIKIGVSQESKKENIEFNTTTNRRVSVYADQNIKFLVNKHRPQKKGKKDLPGSHAKVSIDLEDKGNIAVFNPFCVSPFDPLSFFTTQKLGKIELQSEELKYIKFPEIKYKKIFLNNRAVFMSEDLSWVGHNPFFNEHSEKIISIYHPKKEGEIIEGETVKLALSIENNYKYWLRQLEKVIEFEEKGFEPSENYNLRHNIDEIYENIDLHVNLLEQIRFRLMNKKNSQLYEKLFKYHPRLYSAFNRLCSFYNYGNSKYSIVELADEGFYNKSDMYQDLVYYENPDLPLPTAEEQHAKSPEELRNKLVPHCRVSHCLPFPNVKLDTCISSMHAQKVSSAEVVMHFITDPYILYADKKCSVSLWCGEMMIYKMFEFDYTQNYKKQSPIPSSKKQKEDTEISDLDALFDSIPPPSEKLPIEPPEIIPDQSMLQQLISMGYGPSTAKKALINVKNQSVVAALDAIEQIHEEQKQKKEQAYKNIPGLENCELYGEDLYVQEVISIQIQAGLKEQEKAKKAEQQKRRQEKLEQEKKEQEIKKKIEEQKKVEEKQYRQSTILDISFARLDNHPINPFFIYILLKKKNGEKVLRIFRVGINRRHLLNFYRIEDEMIVSNLTREVSGEKTLQTLNRIISAAHNQINWGIKLFEAPSDKDWVVFESTTIDVKPQVTKINAEKTKLFMLEGEKILFVYELDIKDTLEVANFSFNMLEYKEQAIIEVKNVKKPQSPKLSLSEVREKNCLEINEGIEQVTIEVVEHYPAGKWKAFQKESLNIPNLISSNEVIMSEFIPLSIEYFDGSVFSSKYSSSSIMEKGQIYTSNYPDVEFVFKSIDEKPMLIESVSVISKIKKTQKIYPLRGGLVFTANNLSWFTVAKDKFGKMDKKGYEEWENSKCSANSVPSFWQPVAFFEVQDQIEFELKYKRVAKYIYFLPTTIRKQNEKDEVAAMKIDFFGVKGRIEESQANEFDVIDEYKRDGPTQCVVDVSEKQEEKWKSLAQDKYLIRCASSPNTYHFNPKYLQNYIHQSPLSITTVFEVRLKDHKKQKQIKINSDYFKHLRIIKIKKVSPKQNLEDINSFTELIPVHNKIGGFDLQKIVGKLDKTELLLKLLAGEAEITQFENLLTKILKNANLQIPMYRHMCQLLPGFCSEKIEITEAGMKSFLRVFEKIMSIDEGNTLKILYECWVNLAEFLNTCRNKNYNILRNHYHIEDLVLEPALFSKDYYRLIHPNYVEEEKPASLTAEPQTPINTKVYIEHINNFNFVYYVDIRGHENIDKVELHFPKIAPANKYKLALRVMEISEEGQCQLYYRYFHEDLIFHLGAESYKDTEIYKKSQINYMSLGNLKPSEKCQFLKIYVDLLMITTMAHPRFKELPEPYIILPVIRSQNYTPPESPLTGKLATILDQFPQETKHNSTSERMPPHRYAAENKKMLYIVHEFKSKYKEENKNQFTSIIDKITQNIMDKSIVEESIKSIRISDYDFGYKGVDFAFTLMIHLIKLFRKLPQEESIDIGLMFTLFDNFVIYESGPIMNQTSSLLLELYNKLSNSSKCLFIERIIDKYLGDVETLKSLKVSEKYSVQKIIKFLSNFHLPTAQMLNKLGSTNSAFLSSVLIKIELENLDNFKLGFLEVYQGNKFEKSITIDELINISFHKCLWILDNVKSVRSQMLSSGLDLFLKFFPKENSKEDSDEKAVKSFIENMDQTGFWKLIFLTLTINNEGLKQKINFLFKILLNNKTESFEKSINNMLLQIIKKSEYSLYLKINQNVSDQQRMSHLQTILEYLSILKNNIFLDTDTAVSLLQLPLTPTLWSLALKIIPREDIILTQIIKNFNPNYYSSLGKEIMQFCEPLAGIRSLQSIHINWLELVKIIRLEGKSVFYLFIESLKKSSFGGRAGLTMSMISDVKQLEITAEFIKLVLQSELKEKDFTDLNIHILISWYFLNSTQENGLSPATDKLKFLSESILKLFEKVSEFPSLLPKFIKELLIVKRESQTIEKLIEDKRISSSNALILNSRFCECFQTLINIFTINDELYSYLAFEIDGLKHLLKKIDFKSVSISKEDDKMVLSSPEEQFLLDEKLIISSNKNVSSEGSNKVYSVSDLKEDQFANSVQLMKELNEHNVNANNSDWTFYKKGNKTKILYLPLTGKTYHEYPLHITLNRVAEVRSIKMGFMAASYEFAQKLIASPSSVILEGSLDGKSFEPMGEMSQLYDDGYACNGVKVFVLNFQKIHHSSLDVLEVLKNFRCHRVKHLRIIVKRPMISFVEGQYSPLNGKHYKNLGCNISFLSVTGDDVSKLPYRLEETCKQISKESALKILNTIISEYNPQTARKIALDQEFIRDVKQNFGSIKEQMKKYPHIVPNILFILGSNNEEMGDWIINNFLSEGNGQIQAKIINQIMISSEEKIYDRLAIFLNIIFKKLGLIVKQSDIESGLMYAKEVSFIESFCKTLEESYDIGYSKKVIINIEEKNIDDLINIFDKKYASPQIKTIVKLLISLLYVRKPIQISNNLLERTLNLVWENCSQAKPYFYQLMAALLVNKQSEGWIKQNDHARGNDLIKQIKQSIEKKSLKLLNYQMCLLMIISYHEQEYLRKIKLHLDLYNRLKVLVFEDSEILDNFTKVVQNLVLEEGEEQEEIAKHLIADVGLLVKRKDPILQKFYVSLLGLEKEVQVNLKGFNFDSGTKKDSLIPSKILNKSQVKLITDKINKKIKFTLSLQAQQNIKNENCNEVLGILNTPPFLILMRLKLSSGKNGYFGCFGQGKTFRADQDSYCWEDSINFDKGSFSFYILDGEIKFIETSENGQMMLSLFGGEEQLDEYLVFYEKGSEIVRIPFSLGSDTTVSLPGCSGCRIQQIQFYNGNIKSQSTDPNKLLNNINKAKTPFTLYRHSNIYVFPGRISIQKFLSIIGVKGNCRIKGNNVNSQQILGDLKKQSMDFILDVEIASEDTTQNQKQEDGYIPTMNIFDRYSKLGGVNEVLQIGSKSIKDWKSAEQKKNFEHYMSELKQFVNLPNFFNLFIKNQQSVTFLFEVASGLPDDPNNTRNWSQEQVISSKFIYKILSDIFKYDRSSKLRDMDNYSQFCEIILEKLAQVSKEIVRQYKEDEENDDKQEEAPKIVKKKSEQPQRKKKKGTGYGADSQNNPKWSASEWIQNRKMVSEEILRVVLIYVSFLECEKPLTDSRLSDIIKSSCLLPLLESSLRSGSLLDISKEAELFKNYLHIIKNLANNPATIDCLLDLDKKYKPPQTESIHLLLGKLNGTANIFLQNLKANKVGSENEATASVAYEIQKTHLLVEKAVKRLNKGKTSLTIKQIKSMPVSKAYGKLLGNLRFGYVDLKVNHEYKHFYSSSISSNSPSTNKILRLSQELADLSSSLPCENTNSIFVRCDKSRIDVVKILIMGSKDTPYSNGAFMFDLYCDDSYPQNPPKMSITTTGRGTIRFNPNLYSCGKVCLSLLGTWRGQASENWDAKLSTLLQLFISTQGITMSEDVYFNQPGFDNEQGTVEGEKKNQAYSNIVRLGNVRFAMNEQIKNPPKGFEDVINRHFYIKKEQILEQSEKWLEWAQKKQASYNGLVNDHNSSWCGELKQSKTKYRDLLKKEIDELRKLLADLPEPNLEEKEEEITFSNQKAKKKARAKEVKLGEIDVSYEPGASEKLQYEQDVMQDRWSRYIGAMGIEAVKKQSESKVLLIGLKSLGLEIAKNLVLSGLKQLTIVEKEKLIKGSEEHFYMSDLKGKSISECLFKIKELNPYMLVNHSSEIPQLQGYNIVISTDSFGECLGLAEECRNKNIKFIHTQTCGVSGTYFADYGESFSINDTNGEEPFEGLIKNITCEEEGIVTLLDGVKHPYEDGDYIVLNKVQGMEEIQQLMEQKSEAQSFYDQMSKQSSTNSINGRVFKIKVLNWNSFIIGDTRNFKPFAGNGICKNIKLPKKVSYKSFAECLEKFENSIDNNMGIYDFEKMGDNFSIFSCFHAFSEFKKKNGKVPRNWNQQDMLEFGEIVKKIATSYNKSEEEVTEVVKFGKKFACLAEAELPTIGAYLGGLVSQEVIKGLTNKYTPIKQFFTFHINELAQDLPEEVEKMKEKQVGQNEAFMNLKIVVGKESFCEIEKMNTFIIGAGAIGCELLKNFAMINMGAKGTITVTDPDHIETSNLTRQFLFRQKHVKKPKSATASATLVQMNPFLKGHISARLDKVCQQTEQIYSDQFFEHQTIVANALDNVRARVYIDKRCVKNNKPLFESGTLGPKGHVQVIVPKKTQNYGNQNDPAEENQIPHCTLKMFPEETVHCIEWSRDIFGKVFTLNPKALKKVIDTKDPNAVEGQQKITISKMIEYKPLNIDDCIAEAVRKFYVYFRNNVRQLLHTYPLDMKTKEGKFFWELPKRPPKQITELNMEDEVHQTFISSYAVLLAKTYDIPYPKNFRKPEGRKEIMVIAKKVKVEEFVPTEEQSKKLQQMAEKEQKEKMGTKQQEMEKEEDKKPQQQIKIKLTTDILDLSMKPEEFEKDEDSNGHIDLIYSMSNLRARNYGLNECTWIQAKLKAGRIMAALSTTTSVVSALQTIQIMKYVVGSTHWRNAFVNLAVPLVQISEPGEAPKHKIGNTEFTVWDHWEFKCSTLKDLLQQIRLKYQVQGYNISTSEGKPIFWQAMYKDKEQAKNNLLNKKLSTMFTEEVIQLNVLMRDLSEEKKPYENIPSIKVQIA